MTDLPPITRNPTGNRFELRLDGYLAWLEWTPVRGGLAFTHTIVPAALGGRGIGSRLVRHALDWAIAQRQKVRPDCSFVKAYIDKHPQYQAHELC